LPEFAPLVPLVFVAEALKNELPPPPAPLEAELEDTPPPPPL
jgi:hypothetical protein